MTGVPPPGVADAGRSATAGRALRVVARQLLPGRDTPYTAVMAVLLAAAAVALWWGGPADPELQQWASTNLVNLRDHPTRALIASIFVTGGGLPREAVLFVAASSVLERHAGALRAAVIPLVGHVIATLLTEGAVRVAIWRGALPRSDAWQLDIGVSYAAYTAAACATGCLPRRTQRILAGAVLVLWTGSGVLGDVGDMTVWGHFLCVLMGLLSQLWLPRDRADAVPPAPQGRRAAGRGLAAWVLAGLAATGVVLVDSGAQLVPAADASSQRVAGSHAPAGRRTQPPRCPDRSRCRSRSEPGACLHPPGTASPC